MPNWCENAVEISGPKESIQRFYKVLTGNATEGDNGYKSYSLLRTFLPISEYFDTQEGYNAGGYEWCLSHWGCKWSENHMDVGLWSSGDRISLDFETPWSPPMDGYMTISTFFPDLMFRHYYKDEGMCFMGISIYQNNILVYRDEIEQFDFPEVADGENEWDKYDEYVQDLRIGLYYRAEKAFSIDIE